jgi:thiol-disulfide isomerase/thioredoxin
MKKICLLLVLIIVSFNSCKTTKPAAKITPQANTTPMPVAESIPPPKDIYSEQSTWVLGYFTIDRLTHEPHSTWYIKGHDEYQANSEAINKLLEINKDGVTIKIVMGTWCPDSRREVPRFMRIIDTWQFPVSNITFIGVDNAKLSPVGEYTGLGIEWVPTFIIFKNNIEKGRIIENPKTSLEQDMVNILTRNE